MTATDHGVAISIGVERYLAPWANVQSVRFEDAPTSLVKGVPDAALADLVEAVGSKRAVDVEVVAKMRDDATVLGDGISPALTPSDVERVTAHLVEVQKTLPPMPVYDGPPIVDTKPTKGGKKR